VADFVDSLASYSFTFARQVIAIYVAASQLPPFSLVLNMRHATHSTSRIAAFRRCLLRIHGTILMLVALGSAVATTIGRMTGTGLFGFMHQNPMVWVGLIQAYLLMAIIAVLLVIGSGEANARKWNVIGALAHCAPLIAAFSSLDVFESMGALGILRVAITFHVVWLCLETFAAVYPSA
jgi:hypothetical protein